MNRNKKITKTMAAAFAGLMVIQSGAGYVYAQEKVTVSAKKVSNTKEETVYVKTDPSGKNKEVIVSEWLKNPKGEKQLADASDLTDIENVKGEEEFTREGNRIVWDADGKDIYYQGTTSRELPVGVEITYYLDGKKISPEELAGKSGHVKIRYQYQNLAKDGEVYVPFTMITGIVLPGEHFSNTTVTNGKVISDGEKDIVIGVGLPGLSDSLKLSDMEVLKDVELPDYFELESDVNEFELTLAMTIADQINFDDLGLDKIGDMDELKEKLDELKDGAVSLLDGSGELSDGVQTLRDSCEELLAGMNTVDENMGTLADGISTLNGKKEELTDGIGALVDGINLLDSKKGELLNGITQLDEGSRELKKGAKTAKDGSKLLADSTKLLLAGTEELANGEGSRTLLEGSAKLLEGSAALKNGSAVLVTGLDGMLTEVNEKQMPEGAQKLADGSASLAGGLWEYTNGVNALLSGLSASTENGQERNGYMSSVNGYVDGVNAFLDAVSAMPAGQPQGGEPVNPDQPEPAEEITEETVTKTTISEQSVADIQAVLSELQGVQAVLGSSTPKDLLAMAEQYPAYVAKLENCIDLLNESLGGIKDEEIETTVTVKDTEAPANPEKAENSVPDIGTVFAPQIAQLKGAGAALKAQSEAGSDPSNPTLGNAIRALLGTTTVNGVEMPVSEALNASADAVAKGAASLNGGVKEMLLGVQTKLLPGAEELSGGAEALYRGTYGLNGGLQTLFNGAGTIAANMSKLSAGVADLAKGNSSLSDGAAALASGIGKLNKGAQTLSSGIGTLSDGGEKLRNGAGQLSEGIEKLADGSAQLKEGTGKLSDGGRKLTDGAEELKDGAEELADGMETFYDEGITKITDVLEGDVGEMLDRLEAIKDAGAEYRLMGDATSSGSMKFIIESGAISIEE